MLRHGTPCAGESSQHRPALLARAVAVLVCLSLAAPAAALRGDANCSGDVGAADLPAVAAAVFEHGTCADTDVDGDGATRANDVTTEIQLFSAAFQRPAFEQVLDQILPDGSLALDTARQMFQLAYGGLDGVTVPGGPLGSNLDGTIALMAMLSHQDDLSPDDAARFDAVLNADGPVSTTIEPGLTPPTLRRMRARRALATLPDVQLPPPQPSSDLNVQDFKDRIEAWLPQIVALAKVPFALPIDVVVYNVANPDAAADAFTFDANGGGGAPARCHIRFFKGATDIDMSDPDRDNIVVHELWHCFEAVIVGNRDAAFGESPWIVEGQAEYVGARLTATASIPYFPTYLRVPELPLFAHAYSAIGFYVTMESDGADMFPALKAMLLAGATKPTPGSALASNQAAFDAALPRAPRLLDTWGEMEFEESLYAGDWNYAVTTGSVISGLPPPPSEDIPGAVNVDMGDGSSVLVQAPAHTVFLWKANLTTDFIHFRIEGAARLLDQVGREYNDLSDIWLCQHPTPDQCKCPEGSAGEAPASQPAMGPLKAAASAGDDAVHGVMTSVSLTEICSGKKPPDASAFCDDARNLLASVNGFLNSDLTPVTLQTQLQADVYWLGLMAQDAPADIVAAVTPLAAAYTQADADFGSIVYAILPTSLEILQAQDAAIAAVAAVTLQSQQVGTYIPRVCGFEFAINGV